MIAMSIQIVIAAAVQLYEELTGARMHARKWLSNSNSYCVKIPSCGAVGLIDYIKDNQSFTAHQHQKVIQCQNRRVH